MISTLTGQFNEFTGLAETTGDDFTTSKIRFEANINSISTNNEQRDAHLKTTIFLISTIIRSWYLKASL